VLTVSVFIVLLVYVTLDAIYFHVFFSSESAVVVPLVQGLIVMGAMVILLFIQQRERKGNFTERVRA